MRRLLITGARVLDPNGELHRPPVLDVLVADGRIAAVGDAARDGAGDAEMLDAAGCLLTPGLVNAHSHSHDTLLRGRFEGLPLDVWGLSAFPSSWPRRSAAEVGLRARLHAAECLLGGITTVQDMVSIVGPDREQSAAVLDAYRESGIRTVLALQFADRPLRDTLPFPEMAPSLTQAGSDPAPMQRMVEDLLDTEHHPRLSWGLGPSAPQRCSEALLRWVVELSYRRGLPVFTHLYEARSQAVHARLHFGDDGGSLVSFMARLGLLGPRLVVAHGVWISEDEIRELGVAGAHLACNPAANLKLLNGVAPVRAYADAGVGIALGCDNSSAGDAQSMFTAMKLFALAWAAQSQAGEDGAAANAFRAATLGGASALGLQGLGRIEPGYRAEPRVVRPSQPGLVAAQQRRAAARVCRDRARRSARACGGSYHRARWLSRHDGHGQPHRGGRDGTSADGCGTSRDVGSRRGLARQAVRTAQAGSGFPAAVRQDACTLWWYQRELVPQFAQAFRLVEVDHGSQFSCDRQQARIGHAWADERHADR